MCKTLKILLAILIYSLIITNVIINEIDKKIGDCRIMSIKTQIDNLNKIKEMRNNVYGENTLYADYTQIYGTSKKKNITSFGK